MKKKVALLLALVMILSILPMNVFGDTATGSLRVASGGTHDRGNFEQNAVFEVHAVDLRNVQTSTAALVLRVYGGNAGNAFFSGLAVNDILPWVAGPTPNTPLETFIAGHQVRIVELGDDRAANPGNYRQLVAVVETTAGADVTIPHTIDGTVLISIPMVINAENTRLNATFYRAGATNLFMPNVRLDRVPTQNMVISRHGEVRNFATEILPLPPVVISETTFGNFNSGLAGEVLVRLEAQPGYRWHLDEDNFAPGVYLVNRGINWGGIDADDITAEVVTGFAGGNPRVERVNNTLHQVLYLSVNIPAAAQSVAGLPRVFRLTNLHLVPETAPMGAVHVYVSTIDVEPPRGADDFRVIRPGTLPEHASRPLAHQNAWRRTTNLHVGNRVTSGLAFSRVATDNTRPSGAPELPVVRTGYFGGSEIPPLNFTNLTGEVFGTRTATVEVRELAPGAWSSILGDRVQFFFEQSGVSLVGAAARLGHSGATNPLWNVFPGANHQYTHIFMPQGERALIATSLSEGQLHINPNRLEVTVPPLTTEHMLSATRTLQVMFWISVEAGFEAANPGQDIYVTIGGPGVSEANLATANRRVAVARPEDPVSIRLPDGPVQLVTDIVGDTVANQFISDIEIVIYDPHMLSEGSYFEVIVAGVEAANRALGLHVFANRVSVVQGTGLVLGQITRPPTQHGVIAGSGFVIPINLVPSAHENTGPIIVRIEGVRVTGTVVPYVEYNVILGGTAVAENRYTGNVGAGVGYFDSIPYRAFAISNARASVTDPGTGLPGGNLPGGQLPGVTRPGSIALWQGMPTVTDSEGHATANPFMFHNSVSMMGIRAFAHLAGLDAPVWDGVNQQATLTGTCITTGDSITLLVGLGSFYAQVTRNGVAQPLVDIASASNYLSGPRGTVRPLEIEGRIFLPVRFVAETFGFVVDWDGSREIVTLR